MFFKFKKKHFYQKWILGPAKWLRGLHFLAIQVGSPRTHGGRRQLYPTKLSSDLHTHAVPYTSTHTHHTDIQVDSNSEESLCSSFR